MLMCSLNNVLLFIPIDPSQEFDRRVDYNPPFAGFDAAVLEILVEFGANINAFDDLYETPLNCVLQTCWKTTSTELPCALMYYGADPSIQLYRHLDPILENLGDEANCDLILPYFHIWDVSVFKCWNIRTIAKLWQTQSHFDKLRFAEVIEESEINLIKVLFDATYCSKPYWYTLSSFLYELFESEEMYEVMYSTAMGKDIQTNILCAMDMHYHLNIQDKFAADILRLSLCNYNRLYFKTYFMLLHRVWRPRHTIEVLEDFNVSIECESHEEISHLSQFLYPNRSWRMYLQPPSEVKLECEDIYETQTVIARFYKVKNTNPPSLKELSRNIIRQRCRRVNDEIKPFSYAIKIKSLSCPKIIHDIILLRQPIYN